MTRTKLETGTYTGDDGNVVIIDATHRHLANWIASRYLAGHSPLRLTQLVLDDVGWTCLSDCLAVGFITRRPNDTVVEPQFYDEPRDRPSWVGLKTRGGVV